MDKKDSNQSPDILNELRTFIAGATRTVKFNELDLTRTALSLLKTLPAVRDAVLEYFFTVFDTSVRKYVTQLEDGQLMNAPVPLSQQEDAVISEIYSVICSFVTSNPEAWAPIISAWSLKLLGEVSSHYSHLWTTEALHETLQLWMSCKATRTLVDITTQCLSCLINSDTESCISALLDTSVKHSPHFDWVVAHVGSCFPLTVITRVLSCGLKDFCSKGPSTMAKQAKLVSVVGILGHLASSQFVNIRSALLQLFQWGLEESNIDKHQRVAVVPFLLQLVSQSPMLLKALLTDVITILNEDTLVKLAELAPLWLPYFKNDPQRIEDLVVHLVLHSDSEGAQIISILLNGSFHPQKNIGMTCKVLLELLLSEIDVQIRTSKCSRIPFLESVKLELNSIQYLLLSNDPYQRKVASRLIESMEIISLSVVIESASYLLLRGTENYHISTLIDLLSMKVTSEYIEEKNILSLALEQALRSTCSPLAFISQEKHIVDPHQLWKNLSTLLRYEANGEGEIFLSNSVSQGVRQNLVHISDVLSSCYSASILHCVTNVLELLPTSATAVLPVQITLRLTKNCVKYYFICVAIEDRWEKVSACRRACDLLRQFCSRSSAARALALRELLESSLFLSPSVLFGATKKVKNTLPGSDNFLMEQNHKLGATIVIAQRQSSVFGNGVIGHPSKMKTPAKITEEQVEENTHLLLQAIKVCCGNLSQGSQESLDAMIQVSLLMVELISPDVMYNGLPWPEEEFCKVTIERDLFIRRIFDEYPLTWKLLALVARNEPSLSYCSVLLRALMATLMSQWSSTSAVENNTLVEKTVRLLNIMTVGQLLPVPLSSLHEIVPVLTPSEVVFILRDCVWNYMRDNVPAPALFTRNQRYGIMWRDPSLAKPSAIYTDTMRIILQNNIQYFGQLYYKLFVLPNS